MAQKQLKIYVKEFTANKIKFKVFETKLPTGYAKVKFTRASGVDTSKLETGYHMVVFNSEFSNVSYKSYDKKDGTKGKETIIWIDDPKAVFTKAVRTRDEQEQIDSLFEDCSEDLPF